MTVVKELADSSMYAAVEYIRECVSQEIESLVSGHGICFKRECTECSRNKALYLASEVARGRMVGQ